jgi:putative heme-binding domain-containing protein
VPEVPSPLVAYPAVEPGLLKHPLLVDWSADGALWVVDAASSRGPCRLIHLSDQDNDGRADHAEVFVDGLPWVSGWARWRTSWLVLAAPDFWFMGDSDNDRRADTFRRLWVGFGEGRFDARAGSLEVGLDGWIHGANGGGAVGIQLFEPYDRPQPSPLPEPVELTGSDFRFDAAGGTLERASGFSRGGLVRDDGGWWYGSPPGQRLAVYPLAAKWLRRNPVARYPDPVVPLLPSAGAPTASTGSALDLPASQLAWVRSPGPTGVEVNRIFWTDPAGGTVGTVLMKSGRLWSEPVRETYEQAWMRSVDPCFTPVQVRQGFDGAVWVVDAALRAPSGSHSSGEAVGGLWRVPLVEGAPTPRSFLGPRSLADFVRGLDDPIRVRRGLVAGELERLGLSDPAGLKAQLVVALGRGMNSGERLQTSAGRIEALHLLVRPGGLDEALFVRLLEDPVPEVRRQALEAAVTVFRRQTRLPVVLERVADDPVAAVRLSLALALGESPAPGAPALLARVLVRDGGDPWVRAAALSSAAGQPSGFLAALLESNAPFLEDAAGVDFVGQVVGTAWLGPNRVEPVVVARGLVHAAERGLTQPVLVATAALLGGIRDQGQVCEVLAPVLERARAPQVLESGQPAVRAVSLQLLGWQTGLANEDATTLVNALVTDPDEGVRRAALQRVLRWGAAIVFERVFTAWPGLALELRPALIGACIEAPANARVLVRALRQNRVAVTELTPANRERLLTHADEAVAAEAKAALAALLPDRRDDVVQRFADAAGLSGDAVRGRVHFERLCAMCHRAGGQGFEVGPDLAGIGRRLPEELIVAILDPNASMEPRYVAWEIEAVDDEVFSGVLRQATAEELTVVRARGITHHVMRKETRSLRASNASLMPEGLEAGWTAQDLADLIAMVRSARTLAP